MSDWYKWDKETDEITKFDDFMEAVQWYEVTDRRVEQTLIGDARISTVFLSLDHSFSGSTPLIFETMIFGGEHSLYQERYATAQEAREGHKRAVELVKGLI